MTSFLNTKKRWEKFPAPSLSCTVWGYWHDASHQQRNRPEQKLHIIIILLPYYIYIATIIAILSAYYKKSLAVLPAYYSHIMPILSAYWTTAPILRLLFCPNDKSPVKPNLFTYLKCYKWSLIVRRYAYDFSCV